MKNCAAWTGGGRHPTEAFSQSMPPYRNPRFAPQLLMVNYAGLSQSDLEEALRLLTDVLLPLLA